MAVILEYERLDGRTGHLAGRQLLEKMYLRHVGAPMPAVEIAPGGKPYFAGGGVTFSISHTKHHVFCLLADREVGLDAEELSRRVNPALAEKILSPSEREQYEAAPDKNRALLSFWVLKEAAAKCSGKGLQGYPNHTNFSLDNAPLQEVDGCIVAVIQEDTYAF